MIPISVIMSAYREEEQHIKNAIESILNQSFKQFEFIIILDDPQNTKLDNIISLYSQNEDRIKYYKNNENKGLTYCRNTAIKKSRGKYVALMDADDISMPERLRKEYDYLESHPSCSVVTSSAVVIDENDIKMRDNFYDISDCNVSKALLVKNILMNPTSMIRRHVFENVGLYREIPRAEDYDFWLRCRDHGFVIHFIKEPLFYYRERRDSISHQNVAKSLIITNYVKHLHKIRVRYGEDFFSKTDIDDFIKRSKLYKPEKQERYNTYCIRYESALSNIQNHDYKEVLSIIRCFLAEPLLVEKFIQSMRIHSYLN